MKKLDDAVEVFEQALRIEPDNVEVFNEIRICKIPFRRS